LLLTLRLSNNQLKILPPTIGQLCSLRELNLKNNQLTTIPSTISQLPSLYKLILSNNPIVFFPRSFLRISRLLQLELDSDQAIPFEGDEDEFDGGYSSLDEDGYHRHRNNNCRTEEDEEEEEDEDEPEEGPVTKTYLGPSTLFNQCLKFVANTWGTADDMEWCSKMLVDEIKYQLKHSGRKCDGCTKLLYGDGEVLAYSYLRDVTSQQRIQIQSIYCHPLCFQQNQKLLLLSKLKPKRKTNHIIIRINEH